MEIKDLLKDDGYKKVYATNQGDHVLVAFNDNGKNKAAAEIAVLNNDVSSFLFEYLESYNVPTYFVRKQDDNSFTARKHEAIAMVVSVYNVASKSLSKRFGLEEGKGLDFPIVEMYHSSDKKDRAMINEYHAYALGLCDRKDMSSIMRIATKVNAVLKSYFDRKKLKLINFDLQFARTGGQIVLGDALSLDTVNLWVVNSDGTFGTFPEGPEKDVKGYQTLKAKVFGD